jgi:molybdopterin-guanine dinucleotide biosynthesis protein A
MTVEACILAGGLSSRMGRDKARLRLGGKTLLARARQAAQQAGLPVRVIRRDLVPRCGPLGGVYTALRTTRFDSVLLLPCDMPFVTPALLQQLMAELRAGTEAVFFAGEQVGFPFVVRVTALAAVERQLEAKRFALHDLAAVLQATTFRSAESSAWSALNINTPEDYDRARELTPGKLHTRRRTRDEFGT